MVYLLNLGKVVKVSSLADPAAACPTNLLLTLPDLATRKANQHRTAADPHHHIYPLIPVQVVSHHEMTARKPLPLAEATQLVTIH